MKKDQVIGSISLLFGLILTYLTKQIPKSDMVGDPGSRIFPYIACVLFIVCGIGLLLTGRKKEGQTFLSLNQWIQLLGMLALMFAYYFLLEYIGFIPLSIVLLFIASRLFASGQVVPWWKSLIFSIVVTLLLYVVFDILLSVPLPMGNLLQ